MDDTQRLDFNDDEEETSVNRDRPVGNLHMFAGIHGPAQDFPIYSGQNLIGRHASCDITLPAQSVSKKHAILQVRGDCHTICDNDSLNKTRRGKVALAPNTHYALSNGDFLLFADVACRYTIKENVVAETTGVEESEDDSVLVPATQGALAIEKTPGAAIRRIARGAVLARDSGDEDDEGRTRWNDGACGSSPSTSGPGTFLPPNTDTIVPESDEENDTSTSESRLPSLNLQCDSDTDTSRRSSFVPSSQNISTPLVLKNESIRDGRTLTAGDKVEMESRKPTDAEDGVEITSDSKENQEERAVESTSGGSTSEPFVAISGTVDDNLKKENEKMLQDDALKKPSSDSMAAVDACVEEDKETSLRSETLQEAQCELNPKSDPHDVKHSETDEKLKEDNVSVDSGENIQEKDTTPSATDEDTAQTSGIQSNETEEEGGNTGRSLGSGGAIFQMDSDTDVDEDEAAGTGSDLEKDKSHPVADTEQSKNNAEAPLIGRNDSASDSDTDVDEDEVAGTGSDKEDKSHQAADTETSKENAGAPPIGKNEGDSDSDTDVEDDQNVIKSNSDNDKVRNRTGDLSKTEGTPEDRSDSGTDHDKYVPKPAESNAEQETRSTTDEKKEGFHLDSDTDVEEDESSAEVKEAKPESPEANVKEVKDQFNLDSDTDVDDDMDITHGPQDSSTGPQESPTASTNVHQASVMESDTDVNKDDQIPGGSNANVTLENPSTDEQRDKTELGVLVMAIEASALQVDSDTDVDEDDGIPVAPVVEKVGAPERTTHTDGAKEDTEVTKEAAELHLDSDTDDEETQTFEDQVDAIVVQEKPGAGGEKSSVCAANESSTVSGVSTEETKNIPTAIAVDEDETQKSEPESVDLEMMPTQSYLEPQEESELQDEEEEATQAFIFSSTWAEPDPFKRPADPISVLQISSVTLNTSEEEIDENAIAETQAFCTEAELRGPSVIESPEPIKRSVNETIQSPSNEEESEKEVSHDIMSPDATQPVSQCLSARPPEDNGTWLHLKRDVPASVWIRGIQQEGDSVDLEGGKEMEENASQAEEQSLNLELEATQSYILESQSVLKSPVPTETPTVPAADEDIVQPEDSCEKIEQPCSEDTQATNIDATQPRSLSVPDSENSTTQAGIVSEETVGDGATQAVDADLVPTEDDPTQGVNPSVPTAEEAVPETSTDSKEKISSRKGLSRSKKNKEPAQKILKSSETEEHLVKVSAGPGSLTEKPEEQSTGEPQPSEPEAKEVEGEKVVRRRGGRRIVASETETNTMEKYLVSTSRKRASKISSEAEPSTSGISEQRGRKQVTRKKVANEVLKGEQEQSESNTEELKESSAPENPPEDIERTSEDDKKGSTVEQTSMDAGNLGPLEKMDSICIEPSTSSTVAEIEELMESHDNSAEKESNSCTINTNKKPTRNKRRVATRLQDVTESIDNVEKDNNETIDHNVMTVKGKDRSKETSKSLESQQITQEESQGRRGTRKSRVKPSEQDSDKYENAGASIMEEKKSEEVSPADPVSGNEKPRRTRRSLTEDIKEVSENIEEGKGKTRRSATVKDVEPKNKQKKIVEDMPESKVLPKRTRNSSKVDTTKPEQEVKEDVKIEEIEVGRKSRRTQKNLKEEQKSKEDSGTQETSSSNVKTPRRTKRGCQGEDSMEKEETVKETTSKRTRKHSQEEEVVKLEEEQTRRTRKDSKEETKPKETLEGSFLEEEKEETTERKTARGTRRNLKQDEKKSKPTEDNTKSVRSSTRSKASDESSESREKIEVGKKGTEESHKLSPSEEKSKPAVGRGRRAAKKEDMPQVSTPVASRKRGQASKAEVEEKRKKSNEGEEQEGEVETPKKRGRPRKLTAETESMISGKEISTPEPSPSRSTRQKAGTALSNPTEARTPRRTNRMSTSATASSPYVAQSGSAPKILFTGVVDTAGEETIRSLGGDIADSVFDCTHLVTDRVRRTVKFLCALARGIPIVTLDWIDKCKKSGCFLSPAGFLVNDKEQEKNFNFLLSESLQKAKKRPLFEGYDIHVTANVKPEPDHMKDIIRCSGANFLPKMPRSFKEKCVVVSCSEDAARCKSVPASVPITSAEFILSGILRQEVNPTAYLLNPVAQDTVPTPAKRRR